MKTILAILLILATAALAGEMVQVAKCSDETGDCVITQVMLHKLMRAVEYWHDQAQTCKGV